MTVKELTDLYDKIDNRLLTLENAIINHTGIHKWDRVIQALSVILMMAIILMLKFKVL